VPLLLLLLQDRQLLPQSKVLAMHQFAVCMLQQECLLLLH
jgi:hypothetical protein